MQDAATLLDIIRERGRRGLPLERVYRMLFNPDLYLRAYARLYSNRGAMTPGATWETIDGMDQAKIERIIDALRHERYRWTPVRRVQIPKKNGKLRPLGIPTWSDKLLQEVMRSILEAYYEPQFSDCAHGFRPGRGCHTALSEVADGWTGTKWFIEGDIKGCFDNIDHAVLLEILGERIHDGRFLALVRRLLQAGYLEQWEYGKTLSGTPQGGVLSPLLSNVYLDKLDRFVEQRLFPVYNRGKRRRGNRRYSALALKARRYRAAGRREESRALSKQVRQLPSQDLDDPDYRRLHYQRYADDFLLGFAGPKGEAEDIKAALGTFLRDTLKLELSEEKTLITHAGSKAARYLGYDIVRQHADDKRDDRGRRSVNGHVGLRLPPDVLKAQCTRYMRHGKPDQRPALAEDDDYSVISQYQSEFRGIVNYYLLAQNVGWLNRLQWVMETSLLKTLAQKHRSSVSAMARKYCARTVTPHGTRKCFQVVVEREGGRRPLVARFGGIPLRRRKGAILVDQAPSYRRFDRVELIQRLLADECEGCGSTDNVQVHHIRKLVDLTPRGHKEAPFWQQVMAARRRKTLVVCGTCHAAIHTGRPTRQRARNASLESGVR
jgi:group II intron reverse transcriptase/maturase